MAHAFEKRSNLLGIEFPSYTAQFEGEQPPKLLKVRRLEVQRLFEPAPYSNVEDHLVIRCSNQHAPAGVLVHHLNDRVDHAHKFSVFALVRSLLSNRVELVKQQHDRMACGKIKDLAQIR